MKKAIVCLLVAGFLAPLSGCVKQAQVEESAGKLWLLLLGNAIDGFKSTGKWFTYEDSCRRQAYRETGNLEVGYR